MLRLVKRDRASFYIFLVVISFALSVMGTRFFLYISGYPQLGNEVLHIAHVLWGGLLLGLGSLLILVFSNARLYLLAAVMIGSGFGLFMDEVGKFITQTNDYFFRPAAAIIYIFFLLIVFLYIYIRHHKSKTDRELFYYVLDDCKEILDGDLDPLEKQRILNRLTHIISTSQNEDLREFAAIMKRYVSVFESQTSRKQSRLQKWWFALLLRLKKMEKIQRLIFAALIGFLVSRSLIAILDLVVGGIYFLTGEAGLGFLPFSDMDLDMLVTSFDLNLFWLKVMIDGIVGITVLLVVLIRIVRKHWDFAPLQIAVLISLCTSDILGFYFNQFRQVLDVAIDVGIVTSIIILERLLPDIKKQDV